VLGEFLNTKEKEQIFLQNYGEEVMKEHILRNKVEI